MRGILIDPFKREIIEVETDGKLASIYELLGVQLVTVVSVTESDALFLDDEGLFVPKEEQEYFHWRGSNQPYAGRGLILGTDQWEGDNESTDLSLGAIKESVTFLDKTNIDPENYAGFTIITW